MSGGKQVPPAEPRSSRAGARRATAVIDPAPQLRQNTDARGPDALDATCPLVAKVHQDTRRFARDGRTLPPVGHVNHEEVEGTYGHAPDQTVIVDGGCRRGDTGPFLDASRRWNGEELLRFEWVGHTEIAEQPLGRAGLSRPRRAEQYHTTSPITTVNASLKA
jgi:hypothetical protein